MLRAHFILYVEDQARSCTFYRQVMGLAPRLDVPGMTEFELPGGSILGLMPSAGIRRLLEGAIADPQSAAGVPRCELYLVVPHAQDCLQRALRAGAAELSPLSVRDWGARVAYCQDPDGHVLALAEDL